MPNLSLLIHVCKTCSAITNAHQVFTEIKRGICPSCPLQSHMKESYFTSKFVLGPHKQLFLCTLPILSELKSGTHLCHCTVNSQQKKSALFTQTKPGGVLRFELDRVCCSSLKIPTHL